ncbi:MAG: alpha/beta fold hydrolase [Promethearchaeota archaeon]
MNYNFTVGYYELHELPNINFQLNKLIANGVNIEDVKEIAPKIKDFSDWKRETLRIADKALKEGNLPTAAMSYRSAEFFTSPDDPDKEQLYDKFIELFYQIYESAKNQRIEIPYEDSFLPAFHLKNDEKKDTVIMFGGYDSFLEELYVMGSYIQDAGYEVIIFEGPGQGGARIKNKLYMTHEWEKPMKVVLDFFGLTDIILIGISLGGYLCLRAAAFEPRITRVVVFGIIYDFFHVILHAGGNRAQDMFKNLLDQNEVEIINKILYDSMKTSLIANWGVNHGMCVMGVNTPYEYIKKVRLFTCAEISNKITQDVLLLAGSKDHFIPIEMFYKQIEALKNVKSLTCRLFTEIEYGANHCQVGNRKLALDFILNWINIIGRSF